MASQTPPPKSRIVAVCGCVYFDLDEWLFSDFALLHSLAPQSPHDIWLSCKNLDIPKRREKLGLHGEPTAPRVVIPQGSDSGGAPSLAWLTQVSKKGLKARFLEALSTSVQEMTSRDRLIVIIVGHGGDSGGVGVGEHRRLLRDIHRCPHLLQPEEVFNMVRDCQGAVTLIVNTCHSGHWNEVAIATGLANANSNVIVLAR